MGDAMKEKCRLCSEEIGYQTFRREGATLVHVSCQNRDIGAREERRKVVAWLRGAADAIDAEIGIRGVEGAHAARHVADAIERGDHEKTNAG